MKLSQLNTLPAKEAKQWFEQTCAAEKWVALMVSARPYTTKQQLLDYALTQWQTMGKDDWLEAFAAHPMIGDINSLRSKFANTKALAANEQSATSAATEQTLNALRQANLDYAHKHGFIFIICATGLSADTMLGELQKRLPNDSATEMSLAAAEQIKITLLRLNKGLEETQ
jgi:2-oxo-4-hydroxy-4-carboxy-5-ureidoimidazoline decarboxylase